MVTLANTDELLNRIGYRASQEGAAERFDQAIALRLRAGFRRHPPRPCPRGCSIALVAQTAFVQYQRTMTAFRTTALSPWTSRRTYVPLVIPARVPRLTMWLPLRGDWNS